MELTEKQLQVLESDGHLLVTGGPGSGKTTISIIKSAQIAERDLKSHQKVIFLSFARASVSRVVEAIEQEQEISKETKRHIEVETYHSFFWRILKSHGYLIGLPRRLTLITPPAEAVALADIRNQFGGNNKLDAEGKKKRKDAESAERLRLAVSDGRVCFDLFATLVGELLNGSERLRRLLATKYPVVILDEFQDTSAEQWFVVKALGLYSRLIALADPEQRIFDFIGADPQRLNHFREAFNLTEIDFSGANHRSVGTDIAKFGNDILKGHFQQENYIGVDFDCFDPYDAAAMTKLVTTTFQARTRLISKGNPDWSLAILVPTKKMTRLVSDNFRAPPAGMRPIMHNAVVELDAAILGSAIIAHILQPEAEGHFDILIDLICNYYQGKGGDRPTNGALKEAVCLRNAYGKWCHALATEREPPVKSVLRSTFEVYRAARAIKLIGNPDKDWLEIRAALENGRCIRLKEISMEVRNIRLLERGTELRQNLAGAWRENGTYLDALTIVQQAFVKEHFATGSKPESGVVIMNMHKAKGKQFDEVIIFEGWPRFAKKKIVANPDRIVRNNDWTEVNDGSRQNFRVSITRGRQRTTILTPNIDPCVLLIPENNS